MDQIVGQALAKWPNVPHCYGWLALDARGNWRMRDEHAQMYNLPGDKITHPALIGFINRNYTDDGQGRWYFQNGPQRVYVDLEVAPWIAHTEPDHGFVLQTGAHLAGIEGAWLSEQGRLFLQGEDKVALLDDRDLAQCLPALHLDDAAVADERLLVWLEQGGVEGALSLQYGDRKVPVNYIEKALLSEQFNFIRVPRPSI
ncbi:DUF2946 family protein [Herminiimonas sp.]|uniref:DUF2946 family protein n=1 Tax=Herminiimonas sp. TaxID=1926289 RepID=UPI0027227EAC|nr:DUF2946 family protein [Herminiimonas sp.]MDO8305803.1 DUF2946 family protein [Herminiimonas sp.]